MSEVHWILFCWLYFFVGYVLGWVGGIAKEYRFWIKRVDRLIKIVEWLQSRDKGLYEPVVGNDDSESKEAET